MGHFQLDVQPELVRSVKRTYGSIASALEHESGAVAKTPQEIGDAWTGSAATTVKGDMTALSGVLTTFHTHFTTASQALGTLATAYDEGLEDLRTLNTQWDKATTTCASTLTALQGQQDQDEKDLTKDGRTSNRFEHEELADIYADKRSGATTARDTEYTRLGTEYDHLVTRMRTATATAGRALRDATHVKIPQGVAVNLHDPVAYAAALAAIKDAAEDALGDDFALVSERDTADDMAKIEDAEKLQEMLGYASMADPENYDALMAMLKKYDGDPEFAGLLASRLDPAFVGRALAQMQDFPRRYGLPEGTSADEFDDQYLELVKYLGSAYGLATQVTGDYAPPASRLDDFYKAMTDVIEPGNGAEQWPGQNIALASLLSQGSWNPEFASSLTAKMIDYERNELGDGGWDQFNYTAGQVRTPQGWSSDPLETLMAGMAQNRAAIQQLLTSGGTRELTVDGKPQQVSDTLAYLLMERHWNDSGLNLKAALTLGMSDVPGDQIPEQLRGDLQVIVDYAEEQQAAAEAEAKKHDKPWYVDLGHFVLDLGGLIPVVGEVADLINAGWYTAEGDMLNAGLSAAGAVPFLGWAATGRQGPARHQGAVQGRGLPQDGGRAQGPPGRRQHADPRHAQRQADGRGRLQGRRRAGRGPEGAAAQHDLPQRRPRLLHRRGRHDHRERRGQHAPLHAGHQAGRAGQQAEVLGTRVRGARRRDDGDHQGLAVEADLGPRRGVQRRELEPLHPQRDLPRQRQAPRLLRPAGSGSSSASCVSTPS